MNFLQVKYTHKVLFLRMFNHAIYQSVEGKVNDIYISTKQPSQTTLNANQLSFTTFKGCV